MSAGGSVDLRGFIDNSLLEWEDKVSSVAIMGGCNFRCPFCHSWRYVTGLDGLERLNPEQLFELLERQEGWIDGVVFTGGEPTLQPGLVDIIHKTREYGVTIKLHTNGSRPGVIKQVLDEKLLDCLSLDYKAPLDDRFYAAAGIDENREVLEAVRRSFELAATSGIDREYHTTLVPKFVDRAALADMAEALEPGGLWVLQQYENKDCLAPAQAGSRQYNEEELEAFAALAKERHGRVLLKRGSLS